MEDKSTEDIPEAAASGDDLDSLPEHFARALRAQGFTELTDVQQAVREADVAGRDLRISSQTGSGKTVALGFVIADAMSEDVADEAGGKKKRTAMPRGLVIAPTRELAAQLGKELSWLYGRVDVGIAVVTGGTAVSGDLRALAEKPELVIGTPGRLVDHLERGSLDLARVRETVLDEADEMLDMGFRDELEAILDRTPKERRTHLVSATFPPKVAALANRYQKKAVLVEGTVGAKHADISHSAIVCEPQQRSDVLVNLLLLRPEERFLVFVRTRVAATGVAGKLAGLGFLASPLSGEMAQRERTRCLAEFRAHKLQCVVATDVAARGLDIRGVQQIIHYDLPENREAFTHRSGRTGRAGDKGESILLVAPRGRRRVEELFRLQGIKATWRKPPTAAQIQKANRRRLLRKYGAVDPEAGPDAAASSAPESTRTLAEQLLERRPAEAVIADLLHDVGLDGPTEPREIREFSGPSRAKDRFRDRPTARPGKGSDRGFHKQWPKKSGAKGAGPGRGRPPHGGDSRFVPFHVTWGEKTGANHQRMLAHVCRRGGVDGRQIGTINIHEFRSVVDVAADAAEAFERAVARPDPRNPRVHIQKFVPLAERQKKPKPKR